MNKLIVLFLVSFSLRLAAQETIQLYKDDIPNSVSSANKEVQIIKDGVLSGYRNISIPTLCVYLPDSKSQKTSAVIICPGGGYQGESYKREGTGIAKEFSKRGITAFVLKYLLPSDSIMKDKSVVPLQDAQQAIKIVRQHAAVWNLNGDKIGIMGFSAGGHLASTAGTHFERSYISNDEKISLRPDFMILIYPVISMNPGITHWGSRQKLLGNNPTDDQIDFFSNELHVTENTPPTWLTHAGDDTVVPVENSIRFYQELIRNKIPTEMHLYPKGNHGFVLKLPTEEWMAPLFDWMIKSGITN